MSFENPEKNNSFSEDQKEKIPGFYEKMLSLTSNSNDAYETSKHIGDLHASLKKEGLEPKDYFLWGLLTLDESILEAKDKEFDTPDGKIEDFINKLKIQKEEKMAA